MISPVLFDADVAARTDLSPPESVFVAIGLILVLVCLTVVKSNDGEPTRFEETIESWSVPLLVTFGTMILVRILEVYTFP